MQKSLRDITSELMEMPDVELRQKHILKDADGTNVKIPVSYLFEALAPQIQSVRSEPKKWDKEKEREIKRAGELALIRKHKELPAPSSWDKRWSGALVNALPLPLIGSYLGYRFNKRIDSDAFVKHTAALAKAMSEARLSKAIELKAPESVIAHEIINSETASYIEKHYEFPIQTMGLKSSVAFAGCFLGLFFATNLALLFVILSAFAAQTVVSIATTLQYDANVSEKMTKAQNEISESTFERIDQTYRDHPNLKRSDSVEIERIRPGLFCFSDSILNQRESNRESFPVRTS